MQSKKSRPIRGVQTQPEKKKTGSGSKRQIFRRTVFLMLLCGIGMFIPLLKELWEISIVKHEEYSSRANMQQTKDVEVSAERGRILDTNGNVLAMSATVYNLILSPLDVIAKVPEAKYSKDGVLNQAEYDAALLARKTLLIDGVCKILDVDRERMEEMMERTYSQYEVVARNIEKTKADELRAFLTENGCSYDLWLAPDSKRYYPYSNLASHIVGFVNTEGGAYGIESTLENELSGKPGRVVTTKTASGIEMYNSYSEYVDAENGYDVTLTIDTNIQAFAEKALAEGIVAFDVQQGGFCIVMNPNTGAILAMASSPDYDLNNYGTVYDERLNEEIAPNTETYLQQFLNSADYKDKTQADIEQAARNAAISKALSMQWRSQAYQDMYDPGSTFKALVLAAALEEGVVTESDTFYCPGYKIVNGQRINCSKLIGHGMQTLTQAVENSCNPAFMEIGQALGADRFYDYFEAYGLKEGTGIELVGEGTGQIWSREYLNSAEGLMSLATASFGQQFTVTPLQMITGFSAVINGGYLMTPHVVKTVSDQDGNLLADEEVTTVRQVVSEQTSERCRAILESVVANGTGHRAYQAGYRIGGKTGTSETLVKGEVIVSFMGFAPAEDPQIIVLLGYKVPQRVAVGSSYGTTGYYISGGNMPTIQAGPLIAETLDYLGVEKIYTAAEAAVANKAVPQVTGKMLESATTLLGEHGFQSRTVGEGSTVTAQVPAAGALIPGNSTVILYLGGETPPATAAVPDVRGLAYGAAKDRLEKAGFFIRAEAGSFDGNESKVKTQSVAAGEMAALGTVITVTLQMPEIEDGLVTGNW